MPEAAPLRRLVWLLAVSLLVPSAIGATSAPLLEADAWLTPEARGSIHIAGDDELRGSELVAAGGVSAELGPLEPLRGDDLVADVEASAETGAAASG